MVWSSSHLFLFYLWFILEKERKEDYFILNPVKHRRCEMKNKIEGKCFICGCTKYNFFDVVNQNGRSMQLHICKDCGLVYQITGRTAAFFKKATKRLKRLKEKTDRLMRSAEKSRRQRMTRLLKEAKTLKVKPNSWIHKVWFQPNDLKNWGRFFITLLLLQLTLWTCLTFL